VASTGRRHGGGFLLFDKIDHGALLSLVGQPVRAVQYVVGNPLFAVQMTRHNLAAGLEAPLRLLVSMCPGGNGATRSFAAPFAGPRLRAPADHGTLPCC
jgi:hypothetical protein